MTFLKVALVLFIIFLGATYYTISSTAIPLKVIASLINKIDGVTIVGVDGSLKKGFKVKSISMRDPKKDRLFLMENLVADYNFPKITGKRKLFHIKEISVDNLIAIGLDDNKKNKDNSKKKNRDKNNDDVKISLGDENENNDIDVKIDLVSIKNVIFKKNPEDEGFVMKNLIVRNMFLSKNKIVFDELNIKSNYLELEGSSELISDVGSRIDFSGVITTKLIDKLKQDLIFKMSVEIIKGKLNFYGSAFDEAFVVNALSGSKRTISFNNMDLTKSFQKEWPMAWVNGEFVLPAGDDIDFKDLKPLGVVSFRIADREFKIVPGTFKMLELEEGDIKISFDGADEKGRVKFEYIRREKIGSEIILTYPEQ